MFKIYSDKSIYITRGDVACIEIGALNEDGTNYEFKVGDIVRFKVFEKKKCNNVVLVKDIKVLEVGTTVDINLSSEDTKIGEVISKDVDYWYEVELNPDTKPQTIIGYEYDKETKKALEKIFKLLPEGAEK